MSKPPIPLARKLAKLRIRYETPEALAMDPLSIPLRYKDPLDRELAAWVAAHLAYGRVAPMLKAIERALAPLGPEPSVWLRGADEAALRDLREALAQWKWRFHTGRDLTEWILAWRTLDRESGRGLEPHLWTGPGDDPEARLSALIHRLRRSLPPTPGLRFTLPDPLAGSACKRWRMFLRWMVRSGWPDLGLWTTYPLDRLVIPLDTHVARVSRLIGLSRRATPDNRMALEITEALRRLGPADPLQYDFALSHLGILGDCPGERTMPSCASCPLESVCKNGRSSLQDYS